MGTSSADPAAESKCYRVEPIGAAFRFDI